MKRDKNVPQLNLSDMSRSELESRYVNLETEYKTTLAKLKWYEEQYRLSAQRKYGQSSEKTDSGQLTLEDIGLKVFNEAEALREPINTEPKEEDLGTEDKPKKHRKKNIAPLPVVEETFVLTEEEQICPECGHPLHEVKEIVRTEIEVIPAKAVVHRYKSKQYACRHCEKEGTSSFVTAKGAPLAVIPGSMASPSLISHILTQKFVQAVPFYRQEKENQSRGIPVTRNNMCNWAIKTANGYFKPLADLIREAMFSDGVIHCDETFVEVLKEPGRPAGRKSYVWVVTTAEYQKDHPGALYYYREGRSSMDAREVLKGYSGYIMCDGYAAYDALKKAGKNGEPPMDVTLAACLVHIRRKFVEALKLLKPEDRKGTGAAEAVKKINLITYNNSKWNDLSLEERFRKRTEFLRPSLEDFFRWIQKEYDISLPQTKYGQALRYALDQEEKVMNFFLDPRLELNNNMAERTVKPFVIGRKNWLFADTPAGADASCVIYSIVETAKLNNLNPYEYMKYVLETFPKDHSPGQEELENLLPWSKAIPETVKNPV